jgi:hypothetical protein
MQVPEDAYLQILNGKATAVGGGPTITQVAGGGGQYIEVKLPDEVFKKGTIGAKLRNAQNTMKKKARASNGGVRPAAPPRRGASARGASVIVEEEQVRRKGFLHLVQLLVVCVGCRGWQYASWSSETLVRVPSGDATDLIFCHAPTFLVATICFSLVGSVTLKIRRRVLTPRRRRPKEKNLPTLLGLAPTQNPKKSETGEV